MKKLLREISLSLAILATGAYASAQNSLSVISGQWTESAPQKINLYEVKDGALQEIASTSIRNGLFGFAFAPQTEGFYVIGRSPGAPANRYICYLKPGDSFQFKIEGNTYHLTGHNTPENIEMEKWHNLIQPIEFESAYFSQSRSTYKEFFPLLESILQTVQNYPAAKTPNTNFNKAFEDFKRFNLTEYTILYLNTPRTVHPKSADYIDYYRNISIPALSETTAILTYPNGLNLLSYIYAILLRIDSRSTTETLMANMKEATNTLLTGSYIANDTIKGEFMLSRAGLNKTYEDIMDYKKRYEKYLSTEDQKLRFNVILGKFDDNAAGHEAIDFKFRDINGKQVALSDLKGKVVYIDIWATWCGPCKHEIPFLGTLEEEYAKNKEMAFMSVSIDQERDLGKWKDMVKELNLKGIQLFAGDQKQQITSPYKINSIPRFMLVGKDGKMISADAPRPSSNSIRKVLDAALAK